MGGTNSGRYGGYIAKSTVEDCCDLDINWMVRDGMFDCSGRWAGTLHWSNPYTGEEMSSIGYEVSTRERGIRLHYRLPRDDARFDYKVQLTTTDLPWGGVRWWFACPLASDGGHCGRRSGKLYLPPGGRYFGCRHCHDLTYSSSQESRRPTKRNSHALDEFGMSAYRAMKIWHGRLKEEKWFAHREKKNEQRRRRRKAKGWS